MNKETKQRIEEIQKRLEEYKIHRNHAYAYYPEEIKAVREIRKHAAEDIEFLLKENKRLNEKLEESNKFIHNLGRAQSGKKSKK